MQIQGGRAVDVRASYPTGLDRMTRAKRTGSPNVSQNPRSITVTTRPGSSGVPLWSVLITPLLDHIPILYRQDSVSKVHTWPARTDAHILQCTPGLVDLRDLHQQTPSSPHFMETRRLVHTVMWRRLPY